MVNKEYEIRKLESLIGMSVTCECGLHYDIKEVQYKKLNGKTEGGYFASSVSYSEVMKISEKEYNECLAGKSKILEHPFKEKGGDLVVTENWYIACPGCGRIYKGHCSSGKYIDGCYAQYL
ncbi:MAG: hypothetical protein LBK50_00870 [Candidatus Nomurabacteria bacterium]|jgi:hypothetical protein|nr:hypothetical protein [Candidatus Nomurabacteria bacterium]